MSTMATPISRRQSRLPFAANSALGRPWSIVSAVSLALAIAGAGVAAYLTWTHYDDRVLLCGVGDCVTVQQSSYAQIGNVPIALLGLGMYVTIAALGLVRWWHPHRRVATTMGAFGIGLAGALYAAYLTYLELWVIDAICQWCVVSAAITLGIVVIEGTSLWRELEEA